MKYRILNIISVILFVAASFSCSNEKMFTSSSSSTLSVNCDVDDTLFTRSIKESSYFSASDCIDVWAYKEDGSLYNDSSKNIWVRYNGSVWRFHSPIVLTEENAQVYASYPWAVSGDSLGTGTVVVYPGTIDYMWGEGQTKNNCNNAHGVLKFHHALARLKFRFKLTSDSDLGDTLHPYINYFALNDTHIGTNKLVNKGKMDVRTGKITALITGETFKYNVGFAINRTSYQTVDILVIPCDLGTDSVYLNFSLNGEYKQMTLKGDNWEAGKTYTYDVNIHLTRWNDEKNPPVIPTTGTEKGHDWVDLGLPSGVLWATCNIGANSPEELGDYFAWGKTETKSDYSWSTYKYGTASMALTKYNGISAFGAVDNKSRLESDDDVARVKWQSSWRMPTGTEVEELTNYCTREQGALNGSQGFFVTGPNGNSIFSPFTGIINGTTKLYDQIVDCWSSDLSSIVPSGAKDLTGNIILDDGLQRCYGLPVRPVLKKLII